MTATLIKTILLRVKNCALIINAVCGVAASKNKTMILRKI